MQVAVQDKDKNPITDASITVEKDGWDKVTPASDGSYKMENGASYKLTVKKRAIPIIAKHLLIQAIPKNLFS